MHNGSFGRSDLELGLAGWRLTTAEILYRMPDHPGLLQTFVWQTLDLAPDYPRIISFLAFWKKEIEAQIHSVRLCNGEVLAPARVQAAQEFRLWH